MSEARAVTNFAGNAIATVLVAKWTDELDRAELDGALSGDRPFDEATMLDEDDAPDSGTNAGPGGRDAQAEERNLARQSLH
jgi:aerobic C4-dicarboxylate transport protein